MMKGWMGEQFNANNANGSIQADILMHIRMLMLISAHPYFFVAEALDPLGIEVHVEIETPEGNRSTVRSSTRSTSSSASVSSQDEKEEKNKRSRGEGCR